MKKKIISTLLLSTIIAVGCTDLNEKLYDKVSMDEYGQTSNEVQTIVAGAYATLRGYGSDTSEGNGVNCYPTCEYVYFLEACASDEACIPTRGTDWYDGGRYQQAQFHTWDAQNQMILSSWRYSFIGISKINAIIYQVEQSGLADIAKAKVNAELRGLRAYYYLQLLDRFGDVPLTTDFNDTSLPSKSSRQDVFNFVENELNEIIELLPSDIQYARFTQNVAYSLLGRLYLNAEVYSGIPRWQDCLNVCEKVNGYSLTSDYFESFKITNENSKEIILAIPYDHKQGTVGNYLASMTFHYNQKKAFTADESYPWCGNGICAQPGLYSSFDEIDVRRNSLMVGQQKSAKDGSDVLMDDGEPLNYTEEIGNYIKAKQNEGARLNKYEWGATDIWERDNDWVLIRYAEILMMKAEANYRLGFTATALPFINQIRLRAGLSELSNLTEIDLDKEWRHEFVFEGLRRTTNIRFGTFFEPWWNKDETPRYRSVYPIPQEELAKNPNLEQNPNYN